MADCDGKTALDYYPHDMSALKMKVPNEPTLLDIAVSDIVFMFKARNARQDILKIRFKHLTAGKVTHPL